jgi:hypothetical protein
MIQLKIKTKNENISRGKNEKGETKEINNLIEEKRKRRKETEEEKIKNYTLKARHGTDHLKSQHLRD